MKHRILLFLLPLLASQPLVAERVVFNEFLQKEHPELRPGSVPDEAAEELEQQEPDPDPWETFNRKVYAFNNAVDRDLLKPAVETITTTMPEPVNQGVRNFFGNLEDVGTGINNLLQGKLLHALSDSGRVLVNTTLGLAGLFDVASRMKLEKHQEDFGQTLGVWGFRPGPYLVLPILGPSTVRDRIGYTIDNAVDPVLYIVDDEVRSVLILADMLEERASWMGATDVLEIAALDPYAFQRDAYLQKREYEVRDGEDDEEF
ncbi:MAG: VacJ family lipoprotein [Gammaproteobacteria bacterium]